MPCSAGGFASPYLQQTRHEADAKNNKLNLIIEKQSREV
jgi:hypothetical protein